MVLAQGRTGTLDRGGGGGPNLQGSARILRPGFRLTIGRQTCYYNNAGETVCTNATFIQPISE